MSGAQDLPIGSIKPHPLNARKGNVAAIADSLKTNGQFKPILVNQRTGHILAGTHTWKAAKSLGWETIGATFVDVDEQEAVQILLADNRAADAGYTDEAAAMLLLQALPDLAGTGYTLEDLKLPESDVGSLFTEDGDAPTPAAPGNPETPQRETVPIWVGSARGSIDKGGYEGWRTGYPKSNPAAFKQVCEELGLIEADPEQTPRNTPLLDVQTERLATLEPYPGNPRQGDVGMLTELLKAHGQFRPIVVSKNTRRILAGNHIAQAAAVLGWDTVSVSWVTVDEDGERRIVLADNRTSDLAEYDTAALGRALTAVTMEDLERTTGFALEDVQALLTGDGEAKPRAAAEATIRIGNIKGRVRLGLLQDINLNTGYELEEVAAMLRLEGLTHV